MLKIKKVNKVFQNLNQTFGVKSFIFSFKGSRIVKATENFKTLE
jgi:hypothetical protein